MEQLISTPFNISRTVASSSVSMIVCPSVRIPVSLYVAAAVIVTLLPAIVAPPGGLTVIESPFKNMSTMVDVSQT